MQAVVGILVIIAGAAALLAPSPAANAVILGVVGLAVVALMAAGGVLGSRTAAALPSACVGCACGAPGTSACVR